MRDTIDMAREAGIDAEKDTLCRYEGWLEPLKAFEALVRADEREKYKWDVHSCGPTCEKYACVAMREAVEAEREACAKVVEDTPWSNWLKADCAAAIRNRGNT
jgi:hypothetical protein